MNNELANKNKYIIIAIILISSIGAGILGYLQYKNKTIPAPSISPTVSLNSNPSPTPTPTSTVTPPPEVWQTYTNSQLGFSIEYPQVVYGVYRCSPDKDIWVPVKTFEYNKNGITYITQEYYYDDQDSKIQDNTGICKKITYTLESLKSEEENATFPDGTHYPGWKPFIGWKILTNSIKNNTELNKFIKKNYGSGCLIGSKNPWKPQNSVYEIVIKGEDWNKGAGLDTTTCPINYQYKILYTPEKNKIISIKLGQECTFDISPTDSIDYQCYDYKMIDSFRFE